MLVSKNWLADFVQLEVSTESISEKLTALGLEVESTRKAAPAFSGVVVGKVTELEQHPDADKLRVAQVDVGAEAPLQIVCGAPNVAVDMCVPVATVGAVLPPDSKGKPFKIKKTKLRGVESYGMLCSESELGLADNASGLMALPAGLALGQDIREALALDDDIIEIGLTPDRGDCLSLMGVARELAVAFNTNLKSFTTEEQASTGTSPAVTLSAPEACPQYFARTLSGVDNSGKSPLWLVERLRRSGIRSLSPVVDVTNYVMLALGTPLHAFSADAIAGNINVRWAQQDESLTLLDGKAATLDSDMLVIADDDKAIALAGIMGGENSVVHEHTTDIVLESAWFAPAAIVGRARRFNLHTDASHRFERGVDFALQRLAIETATQLITTICGGQAHAVSGAQQEAHLPQRPTITLAAQQVDDILGVAFPRGQITPLLRQLGMTVEEQGETYQVTPPSYRFDIAISEDLVEELARIWGYENIPLTTIKADKLSNQRRQDATPRRLLNRLLVDLGYNEAISYSFVDKKSAALLSDASNAIELMNPLSAELASMRTSLLPSLAKALSHNVNRQQNNVRLYEFGHGYTRIDGNIVHTEKLAGIVTGDVHPLQWGYRQRAIDFFDLKGDVDMLLAELGVQDDISYVRSQRDYLHPGQSAEVHYQGESIGFVGALHPSVEKSFDFDTKVFAFELDIAKITRLVLPVAESLSKYPEIRRDISVLMAQGHQAADIMDAIRAVDSHIVTDVRLFDVYIGRNIPRNTKSMAIAIYLQDKKKTLTDEQADDVIRQITDMLTQTFNAELRG